MFSTEETRISLDGLNSPYQHQVVRRIIQTAAYGSKHPLTPVLEDEEGMGESE